MIKFEIIMSSGAVNPEAYEELKTLVKNFTDRVQLTDEQLTITTQSQFNPNSRTKILLRKVPKGFK